MKNPFHLLQIELPLLGLFAEGVTSLQRFEPEHRVVEVVVAQRLAGVGVDRFCRARYGGHIPAAAAARRSHDQDRGDEHERNAAGEA